MSSADFHIKQNDTSPAIESQLEDEDGNAHDISGYNEVHFHMADPNADNAKVVADTSSGVTVTDPDNGKVKYEWSSGDTDTEGRFDAEWQVEYADGAIETFPNSEYIEIRIIPELN